MKAPLILWLAGIAALWALSIPLIKISVSSDYQPLGLIFWLKIVMLAVLTVILLVTRRGFPALLAQPRLFLVIALVGTILPGSMSFWAASELPAGIMAIIIAVVPMFSLPIAIGVRLEPFEARRLLGVVMGAVAVAMIVGPESSLPSGTNAVFVLIALIAPLCYGIEGNYLSLRGTAGFDPVQLLWAATFYGAALSLPLARMSGQFIDPFVPWGPAEWSLVLAGVCDAIAYAGYIWMVGRAGAVFASQVSYLVTAMGVFWAILLLGESYAPTVWLALLFMLLGIALVRPRRPGQVVSNAT